MNLIPRGFFDDDFDNFIFPKVVRRHDMKCDIYEKDNNYHIEMDIPGFNKEDVNIEINDGNLTIKASKKVENNDDDNKNYIRRERTYQEYTRSFYMGDVKEDDIKAEFIDGVLKITAPKKEKIETKKVIEIE